MVNIFKNGILGISTLNFNFDNYFGGSPLIGGTL